MTLLNRKVKAVKPIRQGCVRVMVGETGRVVSRNDQRKYDFYVKFDDCNYPVGVRKGEVEFII